MYLTLRKTFLISYMQRQRFQRSLKKEMAMQNVISENIITLFTCLRYTSIRLNLKLIRRLKSARRPAKSRKLSRVGTNNAWELEYVEIQTPA